MTKHIYQPALLIVNLQFFNSLPAELQNVLIPSDRTLESRGRKGIRSLEPALLKNLEAQKIVVTKLSAAERSAFKKATAGVRAEYEKQATVKARELLKLVDKGKAAFK